MKAINRYRFCAISKTTLSPTVSMLERDVLTSTNDSQEAPRTIRRQWTKEASASECFAQNSRTARSLTILNAYVTKMVAGCALPLPVLSEHAEDAEVDPMVVEPFCFAQDGFFQKFEFTGDGAAAMVPGGAADFDAVETEVAEAGGDHGAAGRGDDAFALVRFVDPVADAGAAVEP